MLIIVAMLSGALGASCIRGTSHSAGREVQLSPEQQRLYWVEFERRLPLWFDSIGLPVPEVPSMKAVMAEARWFEVPVADADTCWFDPPDRLEIREDLWNSGCVPHEVGHLALKMANHPCWGEWEHSTEVEKCLRRFR